MPETTVLVEWFEALENLQALLDRIQETQANIVFGQGTICSTAAARLVAQLKILESLLKGAEA